MSSLPALPAALVFVTAAAVPASAAVPSSTVSAPLPLPDPAARSAGNGICIESIEVGPTGTVVVTPRICTP